MLSLQQLSQAITRSDVASWLLATLRALGFTTTGWQPGRIQQVLLNAFSGVAAGQSQVATMIAEATGNEAAGPMLTLYSRGRFSNERVPAAKAIGDFRFSNAGTAPVVVAVGQLLVTDGYGVQFSNREGGTIPAGGSLDLEVEAVLAGASSNVANSSSLSLVTSIAGVSVSNPGPGDGVPWYSVQVGADAETDAELQQRNATKWGLLAIEKTAAALENLALSQSGVSKCLLVANNPRGPFTVDIYVAAQSALVSTAEISAAQAAFADLTLGTEAAWPPTDSPYPSSIRLYHPATQELTLTGAVYYEPQFSADDVRQELGDRLDALVASVPIGGLSYAAGVQNRLTVGDILEVMERTRGVRSVSLSSPAGDVVVGSSSLLVPPADWFAGLTLTKAAS